MRFATEKALRAALGSRVKLPSAKPATSKYRAKPTVVDDIRFASKAEATRYGQLKLLERAGAITDLVLQPSYEVAPSVVIDGKRRPAIRYVADFRYFDRKANAVVIEDVKGVATPVYRMKRHLMALLGHTIREVRR